MRRRVLLLILLASIASSLPLTAARADLATRMIDSGPSANRIDIAIVGDGYTAFELVEYASDVSRLVTGLFSQEPFKEYKRYFNVTKVDVVSLQSGADHPERVPPRAVDTAFDSTYNCGGIQRLICASNAKVNARLAETLAPDERDFAIVLVNDAEYGGSGGALTVTSAHEDLVELVLHEFGHSFGLLADEYGGSTATSCGSSEPGFPNATAARQFETAKWAHWQGSAALYEGANYCDTNLFRPTTDSKMRSLGRPFESVNAEQLVRRIYTYVSPIDSVSPSSAVLDFVPGAIVPLRVKPAAPATHALSVEWFVDGESVGHASSHELDTARLPSGVHEITVAVTDRTPLVRKDTQNLLSETATWTIDVPAYARTYRPSDDATVVSSRSRSRANYGASSTLRAATSRTVTRSYMTFEVVGLSGAPTDATLRLRVVDGSMSGGEVRAVADTSWNERRITYRSAPSVTAGSVASLGSVRSGQLVEIDVSDLITGDGTYSFALVSRSPDTVAYSSKEGVLAPTLVINE